MRESSGGAWVKMERDNKTGALIKVTPLWVLEDNVMNTPLARYLISAFLVSLAVISLFLPKGYAELWMALCFLLGALYSSSRWAIPAEARWGERWLGTLLFAPAILSYVAYAIAEFFPIYYGLFKRIGWITLRVGLIAVMLITLTVMIWRWLRGSLVL